MVTDKILAKNVELYIGKIATGNSIDPTSKGNDKSYAEYVDGLISGSTISDWTKVSSRSNEFKLEPKEDETEVREYFGSDSNGAQNTETFLNPVYDVDVSFKVDSKVVDDLIEFTLSPFSDTHSDYSNYKAYVLSKPSSNEIIMFIRIHREINGTHYYRNILIEDPLIKNRGAISGNSGDTTLESEISLIGNKSKVYMDFYSGTTAESLTNF